MQAQHPNVQRKRTGGSSTVVLIARRLYLSTAIVPS